MKEKDLRFKIVDILLVLMMTVPIILGIVLQVMTEPPASGVQITGARIFFTIPMPLQDFPVTESQVNSLIVMIVHRIALCHKCSS